MRPYNFENLTGKTFGKLTVIGISDKVGGDGKLYWKCQCSCSPDKIVDKIGCNLKNSHTKSCGCLRGKNQQKKYIGEMSGEFWCHIREHAKARKIPLEISQKEAYEIFLRQNGKCALTGIDIDFGHGNSRQKMTNSTASLDRKNSKLAYTTENSQWVHKKINLMKWKLNEKYFVNMCKLINENRLKKCTT